MLALIIAIAFGACEKEQLIDLTTEGLTECANCEFRYQESARLEGRHVVDGSNLVFSYKEYWTSLAEVDPISISSVPYSGLFFEVPSATTSFKMEKNELTSGNVVHNTMCIYCGVVSLKPVDGFIQGETVSSNKWLVEASVVLAQEYEFTGSVMDTLKFKQYFTLDK